MDLAYTLSRTVEELCSLYEMDPLNIRSDTEIQEMMTDLSSMDINWFRRKFFYSIVGKNRSYLIDMIEKKPESFDQLIDYFESISET
jgi:hypothetical protein